MAYRFETKQLHGGNHLNNTPTKAQAIPIYQTASYVFDDTKHAESLFDLSEDGNTYSRVTNPTNEILEERLALLEGGKKALVLSSGAAATFYATIAILKAGDHIVSAKNVYGGTYNLFNNMYRNLGIETTFVDANDLAGFKSAIQKNTKLVFVETMSNPNSEIIDIKAVADIAHEENIPLFIDNTFASPYLLRPIEYGADIVIHSATKFIGGHGVAVGGVIIDSGNFNWESSDKFEVLTKPNENYHGETFTKLYTGDDSPYISNIRLTVLRDTGAALSPFNSFLLLQGLETLSLRVERQVFNALKLVEFLANHPKINKVNHPSLSQPEIYNKYFENGAGTIFTVEINGDKEKTEKFINNLDLFTLVVNVGDSKSLVVHPGSTTHSQMSEEEKAKVGIFPNTVRFSVGTENINDLINDISKSLDKI